MTRYPHQPPNARNQGQTNSNYETSIIASVWVIAEGTRKILDGPENMRPLNSQAVFPGKYHMPFRAQQLKLGGVLPVSIRSMLKKTEEAAEVKH